MRWAGHGKNETCIKILIGKSEGMKQFGRPRPNLYGRIILKRNIDK
jgi:hypothetical protein